VLVVEVCLAKLQLPKIVTEESELMTQMPMRFSAAGVFVEFYFVAV
jgi:hypothetical protein